MNGKHRYLTAETFGFKINSNGQVLKRRQQWTIEPFPENLGPDGSISSAASVSSQCTGQQSPPQNQSPILNGPIDPNDPCILTLGANGCSLSSIKSSSNGSSSSDQDNFGEEHENVAIKSHMNKYLAVDSFGNVTCDSDEKTETARFTITICSMSQGRSKDEHIFWAFKNVERGYYLGTTDDGMICCNAKMPKSRAELWYLHLLPARGATFFALKSLGRKRFARVANDDVVGYNGASPSDLSLSSKSQIQLDATISWGPETLFQFKHFDGGKYSLLTSDCRYLTNEGKCIVWKEPNESSLPPTECLFTLEYHSGFLAFRDMFSQYLAAAGRSSVLRSRSIGVSRDELFVFESAPIQVAMKATFNNRWVSIKQGVDLSANQLEVSSKFETFQMTFHKQTQNWSIMTKDCNFWTVSQNTSTISVCKPGDYESLNRGQFRLVWSQNDATLTLKYVDHSGQERWIAARKSGQLHLATANQEPVKFVMRFQNRMLLNLRPVDGSGFVGLKPGTNSKQLEANKTSPDSIAIEYSELPGSIGSHTGEAIDISDKRVIKLRELENKLANGAASSDNQAINMFNVRLNSTKMGNSASDRYNNNNNNNNGQDDTEKEDQHHIRSEYNQKDVNDYCCIDDNNNEVGFNPMTEAEAMEGKTNGVESASAPSVAAIISSFSAAKISDQATKQQQQTKTGLLVSKLASSFEGGASPAQISDSSQDRSSVISSTLNGSTNDPIHQGANKSSLSDQVAQLECCYMKLISNDRYLVSGDKESSSVLCDATNKACAQPWVLELRSHNSLAIRASDNQAYLQLGTNGTISLSRCEPHEASLWEF